MPLAIPTLIKGRCIFLDADTLVVGDIGQLLDIDLQGYPIGACTDIGAAERRFRPIRSKLFDFRTSRSREKNLHAMEKILRLGFVPGENYFNSGVLVMDCDEIRRMPKYGDLISSEKLVPHRNNLPDQNRLNVFFFDNWLQIPIKWNTHPKMPRYVGRRGNRIMHNSQNLIHQIQEAAISPCIWHI